MRRAVELAARGLGTTSPNPVVGCVVLDAAEEIVGEGWHQVAGGPHAEVVALAAAGERARGGTAVVTLEPCSHTGRTGPCTTALRDAGVRRVVYAVADPHPVAAGGAGVLRAADVDVEGGLLQAEAERLNEAWLHSVRRGRPFVIWKYGASLDGQIAAADGTSRWITGEAARRDSHRLRARVDAIRSGSALWWRTIHCSPYGPVRASLRRPAADPRRLRPFWAHPTRREGVRRLRRDHRHR